LGVYSLWADALHFGEGYTNEQVRMASKGQMPAVATAASGACFLTETVKSLALAMPESDARETYAAAVVRMEEG
jgi:hypothetical protein